VEEDGDEFILTIGFKLHEPQRRRHHSDDDSSVNDADYRRRGVSRDLLRSFAIGRQRPNSSHHAAGRRHSLGWLIVL